MLLKGDLDDLGARIVRQFVTSWDATSGGTFPALVRSLAGHEQAAASLRDFLIRHILGHIIERIEADEPHLRTTLCASQLIGIGMVRYVAKFDPIATTAVETVVAAVGPTLQRYLTGDLGLAQP